MRKGRDKFSAFCYICSPKQRKMNIRECIGTLRSRLGSEKLKFSTPNKSFIKGLTNFALAGWLYEWAIIIYIFQRKRKNEIYYNNPIYFFLCVVVDQITQKKINIREIARSLATISIYHKKVKLIFLLPLLETKILFMFMNEL